MLLTSRYRFAAAHRLDTPALTPQQNRALYGKCNNPYGHGHDYAVDITVEGRPGEDGQLVRRPELDALVRRAVIERLDHKNLNADVSEFHHLVPTTENLALVIKDWLEAAWNLPARLHRIRIIETDRNVFEWEAAK